MKLKTIFRCVIKATFLAVDIIAVIFKASVLRDLRAQFDKTIEDGLALVHVHEATLGDEFPRFLPQRAVWLFEIAAHLHECFFFAAKSDRLRADEFLVLLRELRFFGLQRHVFWAKQFNMIFHVAIEDFVTRLRQLAELRMRDVNLFQRELAWLELRLNIFDEVKIRFFRVRIIGVARHRDVTA